MSFEQFAVAYHALRASVCDQVMGVLGLHRSRGGLFAQVEAAA